MERSSVELVVDEFADLVDIWDEVLKKIFLFPVNGKMQNNFPYLDTWPNLCSKLCSLIVYNVEILTIRVILDELDIQARNSHSRSRQYQFLSLKLLPFSFLNLSETSGNVNSSLTSLASQEFGSFYYMWDHYRPVQIRSIEKLKISGTITRSEINMIKLVLFVKLNRFNQRIWFSKSFIIWSTWFEPVGSGLTYSKN